MIRFPRPMLGQKSMPSSVPLGPAHVSATAAVLWSLREPRPAKLSFLSQNQPANQDSQHQAYPDLQPRMAPKFDPRPAYSDGKEHRHYG